MNGTVKTATLSGRRILIVEDEFLIADEMAEAFERQGARILGPAATVKDALTLIEEPDDLDAAVLDINLRGEMVFPVAEALGEKGIPYVFATGYDSSVLPELYRKIIRCEKPVDPLAVAKALF